MWQCLLLGSALALGQPDASSAPAAEPQPAPEAATPAPLEKPEIPSPSPPLSDRWLLQRTFQGTYWESALNASRVQMYGWIEGSYTASTDQTTNLPMGYNYRPNDFLLQQAWFRLTRPVVTSGTEPTWGFVSDWLFGSDYRFTISRGVFDQEVTARDGLPAFYGFDPIQFYLEGYVPTIGRGLDAKFGRFYTPFGVESAEAPSNPLISHSYINAESPLDNTGLLLTQNLDPAWQVQAGIVLGEDVFINPADQPTGLASVQWTQTPAGKRPSPNVVKFATTLGSGYYDVRHQFNHFDTFDLAWTHPLSRRLVYQLEALYEFQLNVPDFTDTAHRGFNNFGGAAQYLTYSFTPRVSGTARFELFDVGQGFIGRTSPDGSRVPPGLFTAVTAGLTFKIRQQPSGAGSFLIRQELRFDNNGQSPAFDNHHQLVTAAIDFIIRW